jgi:hypothetical protein
MKILMTTAMLTASTAAYAADTEWQGGPFAFTLWNLLLIGLGFVAVAIVVVLVLRWVGNDPRGRRR